MRIQSAAARAESFASVTAAVEVNKHRGEQVVRDKQVKEHISVIKKSLRRETILPPLEFLLH